jgi:hypothetical protein
VIASGSEIHPPTRESHPSVLALREVAGLPDPNVQPPIMAELGDPFAELRVVHLIARLPLGVTYRVRDLVDELNHEYVDWSFSRSVVIGAVVQLQANWMADYRNSDGIELTDGLAGPELRIEDSPRVEPWIVRQADRLACACTERLRAFAVEEGALP